MNRTFFSIFPFFPGTGEAAAGDGWLWLCLSVFAMHAWTRERKRNRDRNRREKGREREDKTSLPGCRGGHIWIRIRKNMEQDGEGGDDWWMELLRCGQPPYRSNVRVNRHRHRHHHHHRHRCGQMTLIDSALNAMSQAGGLQV